MSKFIDKLQRQEKGEAKPIGFGRTKASSTSVKMQLVASLAQEHTERAADFAEGVDALLLRISTADARKLEAFTKAIPDILWGARLEGSALKKIKPVEKAGSDFIVFSAGSTPLKILEGDTGRILEVEKTINEGLLRATNELPVDAVLIAEEEDKTLTWHDLMLFRRFADLLAKPLLASIPSEVTADELQAIWDAGVKAIVVKVTPEKAQEKLKELRQAIDRLVAPSIHRKERIEPLLPRLSQEPTSFTVEEEEEE